MWEGFARFIYSITLKQNAKEKTNTKIKTLSMEPTLGPERGKNGRMDICVFSYGIRSPKAASKNFTQTK